MACDIRQEWYFYQQWKKLKNKTFVSADSDEEIK